MKKRQLSFLFCIIMTLSLMPVFALAAGNIDSVQATVNRPSAGRQPGNAWGAANTDYEVKDTSWNGDFDSDGSFIKGATYRLIVDIEIKSGVDKTFRIKNEENLSINCQTAELIYLYSNKKRLVIASDFTALAYIDDDIYEPEPEASPAPDPDPIYPGVAVSSFADISENDYYAVAVKWAVERGVTKGTSASTFSPNQLCTRAHIITFLWRAAGSPEPGINNSYADVESSGWFYKAALWAKESDRFCFLSQHSMHKSFHRGVFLASCRMQTD